MTTQPSSQRRRAENEVVFKEYNEQLQQQIASLLPTENKASFPIGFLCECSDEACRARIELTAYEFERLRADSNRRFMVKPGHDQADIEQVLEAHPDFVVVEKYFVPPTTNGVLNRT